MNEKSVQLETPPIIEGYQFLRVLGSGGMGVVWEAMQLSTARPVAVKFMGAAMLSEAARRRFSREVKLAARITHPNIVRIYDSGLHLNAYYYVMERVEGVPLDEWISASAATPGQIVKLMAKICKAVDCAHKEGVIHRDLKPANILVSADGAPHILDFGLAKEFAMEPDDVAESFLVTSEGDRAGTPIYMSPEQAAGRVAITPASDVYSIGAILYHLLTGRYAHNPHLPRNELYQQIATVPAPPLRELTPDLPEALEAAILRAMSLDPAKRFASGGEFADALLACLAKRSDASSSATKPKAQPETVESPASQATATTAPSSPKRRVALIGIAALILLSVGIPTAWKWHGSAQAKPTSPSIVAVAPADIDPAAGARVSRQRLSAFSDMIRQSLESRLPGLSTMQVAERGNLDAVIKERQHTAETNGADPAALSATARVVGASLLVAPTIMDLKSDTQRFSGYGITTSRTTVSASIRIRVIDVASATIVYSGAFDGRAKTESSTFNPDAGGDVDTDALGDAMAKVFADPAFSKALKH